MISAPQMLTEKIHIDIKYVLFKLTYHLQDRNELVFTQVFWMKLWIHFSTNHKIDKGKM